MRTILKIEIDFPLPVDLPDGFTQTLSCLVDMVCRAYEKENPTRRMWIAGHGSKMTFIPMSPEEEMRRGIEFDETVFHLGVDECEASVREMARRAAASMGS